MGSEHARENRPLAGAVVCCTGILPDERAALAQSATELGAEHKLDLTSDVTHLVIGGSVDTPKYKYVAKERPDVKVVLPSFVDAVKESWMKGGGTDVEAIELQHRVPALYGLIICVTGIENQPREEVIRMCRENGAEYHGDLTKKVTHLIAPGATGKKYEHARRWEIHTVGDEWLKDSVERGMVLDESLYSPELAPGDRGKGAWIPLAPEVLSAGKRKRGEEKVAAISAPKRKLRRTMSAKLGSQHETVWADIAAAGSGQMRQGEWQSHGMGQDSVLGPLNADVTPNPTIEPSRPKSAPSHDSGVSSAPANGGLFGGTLVYIHGFQAKKVDILSTHLESHGARVCSVPAALISIDDLAHGYIVTPHDIPESEIPPIPTKAARLERVTEWWVESCLATKAMVNPDEFSLCRPFAKLRVEGFEGVTICSTGFKGIELLHLTKVVNLMGATYDEYLKPGVSVLICNSNAPKQEKLNFASENNIPAVTEEWLWTCIDLGAVTDLDGFAINPETPTVPVEYVPRKPKVAKKKEEPPQQHANVFIKGAKEKRTFKATRTLELEVHAPAPLRKPFDIASGEAAVEPSRQRNGPFFEEDYEDAAPTAELILSHGDNTPVEIDFFEPVVESFEPAQRPQQPTPLQEQSSNYSNSPKKPSQPNVRDPSPEKQENSSNKPSGSATSDQLNESIAALLAHKQRSSRQPSNPPPAAETNASRRKRGLLGRASSGSSLTSLSRTPSIVPVPPAPSQSQRPDFVRREEKEELRAPEPSQKIIYEDDGSKEQRLEIIRRLGGKVVEEVEVRRGESIGVVKDSVRGIGDLGGGRTRRKGR